MNNGNNIIIKKNEITYNSAGEPVESVSNFDVDCYADFSKNNLKFQKDGENIISKFTFFITLKTEIEKLQIIQKENLQKFEVIYKNISYNILGINHGIKHIQLFV